MPARRPGHAVPRPGSGRRTGVRAGAGILALAASTAFGAGATLTRDEALASSFPGAEIGAERVFLTAEQSERAAALAGGELPSALVARYVARRDGAVVGRAYVDTHVVRTKRESLLISVDPEGRVRRIDATAFLEPPEYLAPGPWLDQYGGRPLDDDLALQRAIRPIAGATLTARSVNAAVRRVLAIDAVLEGREQP
jgi:hypothetical protein